MDRRDFRRRFKQIIVISAARTPQIMPGKKPATTALTENDGHCGASVAELVLKPGNEVANEEGSGESDVVVADAVAYAFVGDFVADVEGAEVNVDDEETDEVAIEEVSLLRAQVLLP